MSEPESSAEVAVAAMKGLVSDTKGSPLPGAVIDAAHQPTGTRYEAVSLADGQYRIFDMQAGGPYRVTANMPGFESQTDGDIYLKLGETRVLDFTLTPDSVEEEL